MTIDATIEIRPNALKPGESAHAIGVELALLRGILVQWTPATTDNGVVATFRFETEAQRDHFLDSALRIPSVAIVRPSASKAPRKEDHVPDGASVDKKSAQAV